MFVALIAPLIGPPISVFTQTKNDVDFLFRPECLVKSDNLFFGIELLEQLLRGDRASA